MKKCFAILLLSFIIFSCMNKERDDNYEYLYKKIKNQIIKDSNILESTYLEKYYEIKDNNVKKNKFDSLYKISDNIEKKFKNLNFSNRKSVIKFRDSVIRKLNLPLKGIEENDNLKLNDSVFKKKMELDIINVRECFHHLKIYDRIEPL